MDTFDYKNFPQAQLRVVEPVRESTEGGVPEYHFAIDQLRWVWEASGRPEIMSTASRSQVIFPFSEIGGYGMPQLIVRGNGNKNAEVHFVGGGSSVVRSGVWAIHKYPDFFYSSAAREPAESKGFKLDGLTSHLGLFWPHLKDGTFLGKDYNLVCDVGISGSDFVRVVSKRRETQDREKVSLSLYSDGKHRAFNHESSKGYHQIMEFQREGNMWVSDELVGSIRRREARIRARA